MACSKCGCSNADEGKVFPFIVTISNSWVTYKYNLPIGGNHSIDEIARTLYHALGLKTPVNIGERAERQCHIYEQV